ncbi:hypothetical protein QAD02_009008 [Eretmocerus hayati]|uniref:Uncharacterized protein n=1 Tax=Eretmocerus hayati TaxID=131215 RepID=A0ACC2N9I2_9HYME|nr:hypothetical protein QAD02_009008 [Eretmocerus hayati]
MKPAGRNNSRYSKPNRDRNHLESPPRNELLYEDELKYFQIPVSHASGKNASAEHPPTDVLQDSVQRPSEAVTGQHRFVDSITEVINNAEACGQKQLVSMLRNFLVLQKDNVGAVESTVTEQSEGPYHPQDSQASSSYKCPSDSATVVPNIPVGVDVASASTIPSGGEMKSTDLQNSTKLGVSTQEALNIGTLQQLSHDHNVLNKDSSALIPNNDGQCAPVVHEAFPEINAESLDCGEDAETIFHSVEGKSSSSDYVTNLDNDQCLQFLQVPSIDDTMSIDKSSPENGMGLSNESLLIDADEVLKILNERDASLYDKVFIANESIESMASSYSISSQQQIEQTAFTSGSETQCQLPNDDQDRFSSLHIESKETFQELSTHVQDYLKNPPNFINEISIEDQNSCRSSTSVGNECYAGHAIQDNNLIISQPYEPSNNCNLTKIETSIFEDQESNKGSTSVSNECYAGHALQDSDFTMSQPCKIDDSNCSQIRIETSVVEDQKNNTSLVSVRNECYAGHELQDSNFRVSQPCEVNDSNCDQPKIETNIVEDPKNSMSSTSVGEECYALQDSDIKMSHSHEVSDVDCNQTRIETSVDENQKRSISSTSVTNECYARHASQDSDSKVSHPHEDNNDDCKLTNINSDDLCTLSETICIANDTTNSMSTSILSDNVSADSVCKDDSLLKVEVQRDRLKSLSPVLKQEQQKKLHMPADNRNHFESTNVGNRNRNSPEMPKSCTDENVIDKIHGLRWLKSPESSSDTDMGRKKLKKKNFTPVEQSSEEIEKGNQAPKPIKTEKIPPGPSQLPSNIEPLSVWSSTNAAHQLFPKPQTPPLAKMKEEEEYKLACAESISTYEKEIELRKMAGVFPQTRTMDSTCEDKNSKVLKDIPDHLRREPRQGDTNNNESLMESRSHQSVNPNDKRPVKGRGINDDQEYPSLPVKGNHASKNRSNFTKKNHTENSVNNATQVSIQKGPAQQSAPNTGSFPLDSYSDHKQPNSRPSSSNFHQKDSNDNRQAPQKSESKYIQDPEKNFDEHPYRNVDAHGNIKRNANDQNGSKYNNAENPGNHLRHVGMNNHNSKQLHHEHNETRNLNFPYADNASTNSKVRDYQKKDQRYQIHREEESGKEHQNLPSNGTGRYRNQNVSSIDDHTMNRNHTNNQNSQEYQPRSRNSSANFDLPYMNQNLTTKNNNSNRNQAYNSRENSQPYKNQDRHDYRGSDRNNRGNTNYTNNYDPTTEHLGKNQKSVTNRYPNSSQKSYESRSREHPNTNYNSNISSKCQTWTPETQHQNLNSFEENWDEDVDRPRSKKSEYKTQQVSNRDIQSANHLEHEIVESSNKGAQQLDQDQNNEAVNKEKLKPIPSKVPKVSAQNESEKSSKISSDCESSNTSKTNVSALGETKKSEGAEILFGDFNTVATPNRGIQTANDDCVPALPHYPPPGLYQHMAMSRTGPCNTPPILPGNSVMNMTPQNFETVQSPCGLEMNIGNSQPPGILPNTDMSNSQLINELSNTVEKLARELRIAQTALLAEKAKSSHSFYVANPSLHPLMMHQDVPPSNISEMSPTASETMSTKCSAPPNLLNMNQCFPNLTSHMSMDPAMMTRLHIQSLYMQQGNYHPAQAASHFPPNGMEYNINSMMMRTMQPQNNEIRKMRGSDEKCDQ